MTSRGERMQQRMRGAGLRDDGGGAIAPLFTFSAPVVAALGGPSTVSATTPLQAKAISNTSAKRRRLDTDNATTATPRPLDVSTSRELYETLDTQHIATATDPYDLGYNSTAGEEIEAQEPKRITPKKKKRTTPVRHTRDSEATPPATSVATREAEDDESSHGASIGSRILSVASSTAKQSHVGTPEREPSSTHHSITDADEDEIQSSSPRASRTSDHPRMGKSPSRPTSRPILQRGSDGEDELLSGLPRLLSGPVDSRTAAARTGGLTRQADKQRKTIVTVTTSNEPVQSETVLHTDVRPVRHSLPRESSPASPAPEAASSPLASSRPTKRRRQGAAEKTSPVKQRQPRHAPQPTPKSSKPGKRVRPSNTVGPPVSVAVQRYSTAHERSGVDHDNVELPCTNRAGVNVIDVLAQLCDEVIGIALASLHSRLESSEEQDERKVLKIQIKALQAFQEELKMQLLEHTIVLEGWYSLHKRIRDTQKQRTALRDQIIKLKAERDQVALRIDAVRLQHEADREYVLHNIDLSSKMHDIDMAVEQGQTAPDLSAAEAKTADLANLEYVVANVAGLVHGRGCERSILDRVKGYNAMLERAAAVVL